MAKVAANQLQSPDDTGVSFNPHPKVYKCFQCDTDFSDIERSEHQHTKADLDRFYAEKFLQLALECVGEDEVQGWQEAIQWSDGRNALRAKLRTCLKSAFTKGSSEGEKQ